ncbi:MAG: hypothetical protein AB8B88_08875 [Devosiaceae bacterium]
MAKLLSFRFVLIPLAMLGLLAGHGPLWAQSETGASTPPPNPVARPLEITPGTPLAPGEVAAPDPFEAFNTVAPSDPSASTTPSQPGFQVVVPDREAPAVPVQFSAVLSEGGPLLQRDLVWTIYALGDDQVDDDDLMLNAQGGTLNTELPPGSYIAHVSFGLATLSRPLTVGPRGLTDVFNFNAGGISLRGAITADNFLPNEAVMFQVFAESVEDFETTTPLARDVDERTVLVVPAGRYTIVSRYGDVNAIVRAQIDVEPGQLTEAVMFHNAAQITLKLVNEPNGEALPNTAWSVLNLGGDIVREFVGAFPTMVLSEGDYTIIARHDGQVFSREFAVVSGVNREEELVAQ